MIYIVQESFLNPDLDSPERSHESFISFKDKGFHQGPTILSGISNFNIISSIPYDHMHLVCIGVFNKKSDFFG